MHRTPIACSRHAGWRLRRRLHLPFRFASSGFAFVQHTSIPCARPRLTGTAGRLAIRGAGNRGHGAHRGIGLGRRTVDQSRRNQDPSR